MLTFGTFHLPSVLLSVASWSSVYFLLRYLQSQRKAEWHCRIVTAIHAILITIITAWSAFVQGPWPFSDAGGPSTPLQVTATTICLGYFLFDFAWCLYFQTEGFTMLLHHTLSITGLVWTLLAGKYGTEMMATICGSEVTNPLLQLRWFLKETKRHNSLLGEIVDFSFMLAFFTVRIGLGSVLLYCYFQQDTDFWGRFGAVSIYLISWTFWVSIFRYAVYKYGKKIRAWRRPGQGNATASESTAAACSRVSDSPLRSPTPAPSTSGSMNSAELECKKKLSSVDDLSDSGTAGTDHVIMPAFAKLSKNGVQYRLSRGLTCSSSAVMDQMGLTG